MVKIKVIAGSTRPGRFNTQPASWLARHGKERDDIEVELLDLKDFELPLLDESNPPMMGQYENKHTKKWAEKITEADGIVMVTPEYNHSTSAALKNAIDYLFAEWNFKPVAFVSYGSAAGGSRAVEHLRTIAAELNMYDLREQILLPNYWNNLDESGEFAFEQSHDEAATALLDQLAFWAKVMKDARQELARKES